MNYLEALSSLHHVPASDEQLWPTGPKRPIDRQQAPAHSSADRAARNPAHSPATRRHLKERDRYLVERGYAERTELQLRLLAGEQPRPTEYPLGTLLLTRQEAREWLDAETLSECRPDAAWPSVWINARASAEEIRHCWMYLRRWAHLSWQGAPSGRSDAFGQIERWKDSNSHEQQWQWRLRPCDPQRWTDALIGWHSNEARERQIMRALIWEAQGRGWTIPDELSPWSESGLEPELELWNQQRRYWYLAGWPEQTGSIKSQWQQR